MLNWSDACSKLAIGTGCFAIIGLLSEFYRDVLPAWGALVIALLPAAVFVFVRFGELPIQLVRIAHVAASAWYAFLAGALLVVLVTSRPPPSGWPIAMIMVLVGALPCGFVLYRAAFGRY